MGTEDKIKRIGLEIGFTHVGITELHDYEDYERDILGRPDYVPFTANRDSLLRKLAKAKTLHPEACSVVCATLGFGRIAYPDMLVRSVARAYLSRTYTPPVNMGHGARIEAFARSLEDLGLSVDRDQFAVPQRLTCAEAGIVTLGRNNFAYTPEDGSFNILVTFLVDASLEYDKPTLRCDCPEGCSACMQACPTQAIAAPRRLLLDRCILFNNQRYAPGIQEEGWDVMGVRMHGCDECQLVCPRNREVLKSACERDAFLDQLADEFDLEKVLDLDEDYYEAVVRPVMYNYIKDRDLFRRNAAVALGNTEDRRHLEALERALEKTDNDEVRKAVRWAIAKISSRDCG